jgi:hypothetical protein
MPRAQTRCSGISSSEQGTSFPLVLQHASLCDRHDFDSVIADLAGARSARHGGPERAPALIVWGTRGHRHAAACPGAPLTPRSQVPAWRSRTPATGRSRAIPGLSCRW